MTLVKAINPGAANQSSLFPIIANINSTLNIFSSHKSAYVKRNQNKLANDLAARASRLGRLFKLADVPNELRETLSKDCTQPV